MKTTQMLFSSVLYFIRGEKVRLQITNLLGTGARENKWYRGQQGSYTLSPEIAAAKDS
jgi:hypothetical protein